MFFRVVETVAVGVLHRTGIWEESQETYAPAAFTARMANDQRLEFGQTRRMTHPQSRASGLSLTVSRPGGDSRNQRRKEWCSVCPPSHESGHVVTVEPRQRKMLGTVPHGLCGRGDVVRPHIRFTAIAGATACTVRSEQPTPRWPAPGWFTRRRHDHHRTVPRHRLELRRRYSRSAGIGTAAEHYPRGRLRGVSISRRRQHRGHDAGPVAIVDGGMAHEYVVIPARLSPGAVCHVRVAENGSHGHRGGRDREVQVIHPTCPPSTSTDIG